MSSNNPPYPPSTMGGGKTSKLNHVITSAIEGKSLGELENIWQEVAASEERLKMMDKLAELKVGFNDAPASYSFAAEVIATIF